MLLGSSEFMIPLRNQTVAVTFLDTTIERHRNVFIQICNGACHHLDCNLVLAKFLCISESTGVRQHVAEFEASRHFVRCHNSFWTRTRSNCKCFMFPTPTFVWHATNNTASKAQPHSDALLDVVSLPVPRQYLYTCEFSSGSTLLSAMLSCFSHLFATSSLRLSVVENGGTPPNQCNFPATQSILANYRIVPSVRGRAFDPDTGRTTSKTPQGWCDL